MSIRSWITSTREGWDRMRGIQRFTPLNRRTVVLRNRVAGDLLGNWFWPHRAKEIGAHGGLGDVVALLPFIQRYRARYPRRRIRVIYTDVRSDSADPESFGHGVTRLEHTSDRRTLVNPIADLLENVSFIDEKIPGDPTNASDFWILLNAGFRRRWGRYPRPHEYRRDLFDEIFTAADVEQAEQFSREHDLDGKFVAVFHFRRAAEQVAELNRLIRSAPEIRDRLVCIHLGSSRNQVIPDLEATDGIDLIDNYARGIPLRTLYQIVMRSQLFVGGRGSFEHFFWMAGVPSINFMDRHALTEENEIFGGHWGPELWEENRFQEVVCAETANPADIFARMVRPYLCEFAQTNDTTCGTRARRSPNQPTTPDEETSWPVPAP